MAYQMKIVRYIWILSCLLLFDCRFGSEVASSPVWTFRNDVPLVFLTDLGSEKLGATSANSYFIFHKTEGELIERVFLVPSGLAGIPQDEQRLYYGGLDNYFRCFDLSQKKILWEFQTLKENQAVAVVDSQKVYWGSADSTLYAVDKLSGELRWKFKTDCHIYAMPVLLDSMLLIGSWDTGLYALHRETGQKLWKFQAEAGIDQIPLLFNQTVWFASYDSHIYGVDRMTGQLLFDFRAENAFEFGGVRWRNTLIFSGIDRHFYFLDPLQEQIRSVGRSSVAISTQPIVSNDLLITGHYDGSLYIWELPTMRKKLLYRFADRVLVILVSDQYLWASSWDRTTVCISLDEK
jgi:outer membrane protein assembly factor BamB